jgi:cytochrome c oxidase assembly factor CtaG
MSMHTGIAGASLAWRPDLEPLMALVIVSVVYAIGVRNAWRHAGRGRAIRMSQVRAFGIGIVVLAIALVSPLDAIADDLFAAHMTQHVLLAVVAPPFLVFGAPMLAALWALPAPRRHVVARRVKATRWLTTLWATLTAPVVAWLLHLVAIWAWHAPTLYHLALRSDAAHAAEHLSFVVTASLVWWRILVPRTERRTGYAIGLASMFGTAMHTGVLGALLTLAHRVLYPWQSRGAAVWGLTALQDQQLAGLIMWVPGGLLYVVAMSALFVAWLDERPPASRRSIVHAAAAASVLLAIGVVTSCSRTSASPVPGGDPSRGKTAISAMGCGACHEIGGVANAHGMVGPPLTNVARRSIIAGELPNTPDNMMRWILDPPSIEPGTAMPNLHVSPQSARDIVAFLYSSR